MSRAYRVQVAGQFADLRPAVRAQLKAEEEEHDLMLAAFTPAGTFTYSPTVTRFTLRYLLDVSENSPAEADEAAKVEGELLAEQFLQTRGIAHKPLTVSAVCLDDVKIKRRPKRR